MICYNGIIMVKYRLNTEKILQTKNNMTQKMNPNLDAELEKIINKVKDRVSREIPDTGYFRNFAENFEKGYNSGLFCKNIALFVQRDEMRDGRAFLGVSALHPTLNKQFSTYIMNGDRNRILEYMNSSNFNAEFKETVLELSNALQNQ